MEHVAKPHRGNGMAKAGALPEAKGQGLLTRVVQLWGRAASFTQGPRSMVGPGGHAHIPTWLLSFKCLLSGRPSHSGVRHSFLWPMKGG